MTLLNFQQHLTLRGLNSNLEGKVWIDCRQELVIFPLWNLSGRLCGYQQYNWKSHKKMRNDKYGKYWTYRTKESISCYGLEFLDYSQNILYVVEGVWDAVSMINAGYNCIATLSNDPKWLRNWLKVLPFKTVGLCDGDKAGKKLGNSCSEVVILPEGRDVNDMRVSELKEILICNVK